MTYAQFRWVVENDLLACMSKEEDQPLRGWLYSVEEWSLKRQAKEFRKEIVEDNDNHVLG